MNRPLSDRRKSAAASVRDRAPARPAASGARGLVWIAVVLLAAAALRLPAVFWKLPGETTQLNTYNSDEYTILVSIQAMDPSRLDFNPVSEKDPLALSGGTFHTYLYAAALKALSLSGWLKLVPDKEFYYSHPEEWGRFYIAGRGLSAAFGLLTIWVVYLLGRRTYGETAAVFAAMLLAVMPSHIVYSAYLVKNVPETFWAALSLYFLWKAAESGGGGDFFLGGACAGLATATRFSSAPLLAMIPVALLMRPAGERSPLKALSAAGAAALFFLATSPYTILDYPSFAKGIELIKTTAAGLRHADGPLEKLFAVSLSAAEGFGVPALLACLAGAALAVKARTRADWFVMAWVLLMSLIFAKAGRESTAGRILPLMPMAALLGGRFLAAALGRRPVAAWLALAVILAHAAVFNAEYLRLRGAPDIRDLASGWLERNVPPGSSIGMAREPSWFNPGLVERHYRHPDHGLLNGAAIVSVSSSDWVSFGDIALLKEKRPDFVLISDLEAKVIGRPGAFREILEAGYSEAASFSSAFSRAAAWPLPAVPTPILYTPGEIRIFRRV
jgi:hypothetical protein